MTAPRTRLRRETGIHLDRFARHLGPQTLDRRALRRRRSHPVHYRGNPTVTITGETDPIGATVSLAKT